MLACLLLVLLLLLLLVSTKRGVFGKFRHRSNQHSYSFLEIEENSLPQVPDILPRHL